MLIDLTVSPSSPLYAKLGVTLIGGRPVLPNAMDLNTLNSIGEKVLEMVEAELERDECTLTGPAPVQVYLTAFHIVVHRFSKVTYLDGKKQSVIIAQH